MATQKANAAGQHAVNHQSGGSDAIKLDDLAAPDNNTDLDVSITTHGLCPKAPNDTAKFLRGDGTWAAPSGGTGSAVTITVNQAGHGLSVTNPVKLSSGSFAKAKADTSANAEVVGIVSAVADVDNFTLLTEGRFTSTGHGLTVDAVYFLSASSAGALTATEPSTAGQVSKPLVYVIDANTLYFHNWRGMVVGSAPGIHHTTHESGGSDAIKLDDLAAPDDNTDLDATDSAHGLCPKLSGVATEYLNGSGGFSTPAGGDGSGNNLYLYSIMGSL